MVKNIAYVVKGVNRYNKKLFLYFAVFTVLSAISPFIGIYFPKWILKELISGSETRRLVLLLGMFFVSQSIVSMTVAWINQNHYPEIIKVRLGFLRKHQEKCLGTDYANTEDMSFLNDKDSALRSMQDNNSGVEGIIHILFALVGNIISLLFYTSIIYTLNIFVLLYLVLTIAVSYVITLLAKRYEHGKKDKISEYNRKSNYFYNVMYDFGYGKDIRLFGIRDYIAELFMQYKELRKEVDRDIQIKNFKLDLVNRVFDFGQQILVYTYTIYMVANGSIDIADFTVYFASVAGFSSMFRSVISKLANLRAQDMYLKDYISFVEKKDKMRTEDGVHFPDAPYVIEFKNVSFKYPDTDRYILRNINFTIKENERIAVVGVNGSGKTTLIKLLCRLYDVSEGEILINGINIKSIDLNEYYSKFSVVFQETVTFAFSLAENVALCERNKCDDERIFTALAESGLAERTARLDKELDTPLQKIFDKSGVELSGGEKQKVSIARALYKAAPVMVLDEPVAALDPLAEYEVYKRFDAMTQNKIAVFISHRLASTRFCDEILFLENGSIAGRGTHEELLGSSDGYREMFELQAKNYMEEEE